MAVLPLPSFAVQLLEWALTLVHSRTFASAAREGGVGVRMMVPLIDLLNHSGDQERGAPGPSAEGRVAATENVEWRLRPPPGGDEGGVWYMELVTLNSVADEEELVLSYGERSNDDFLLHYGFVPPRNPHDDFVLFEDWDAASEWLRTTEGLPGYAVEAAGVPRVKPGLLHETYAKGAQPAPPIPPLSSLCTNRCGSGCS